MSVSVIVTNMAYNSRNLPPSYGLPTLASYAVTTLSESLATTLLKFFYAGYSLDRWQFQEVISVSNPLVDFDFYAKKLTDVADPAAAQDVATKNYVDGLAVPAGVLKFGGGATASGGADTFYFADVIPADTASSATALAYPISGARTLRKLRVSVISNTLDATATLTILKNGAPTTITVNFLTTVTGVHSDTTHTVAFADGDTIDLAMTVTATGGGKIHLTGSVEIG